MTNPTPHLVLAGAGHAHVIAMRNFIRQRPRARITLVTREVHTPYSGMIPGVIAGHYRSDQATIDTRAMTRALGADLVQDEIVGLDAERRMLSCASGATIDFDLLSVDVGSRPNVDDVPGAQRQALPVKPIDGLLSRIGTVDDIGRTRDYRLNVAVVGGGAGGTELAFSLNHRLRKAARSSKRDPSGVRVTIVAGRKGLLRKFPEGFVRRVEHALDLRGVTVRNARATVVEEECILLDDGTRLEADAVVWATQASAPRWIAESGIAVDAQGFLSVDGSLRSLSHHDVFAAGDVADFTPERLPKSGVFAVRQGPVLASNIRASLETRAMRMFKPQKNVLYILSTGDKNAVATRNGISFAGYFCWLLKDYIDRRFVLSFRSR